MFFVVFSGKNVEVLILSLISAFSKLIFITFRGCRGTLTSPPFRWPTISISQNKKCSVAHPKTRFFSFFLFFAFFPRLNKINFNYNWCCKDIHKASKYMLKTQPFISECIS